ncbi:MAG: glycosyltransferase family 2 protein [Hymenobacteraceae bacterium]|nr:glycosyltransferase family 2 protein [Hymenobacteraceae bacterium]
MSVVIPVYNEEAVLPLLIQRLRAVLVGLGEPWEVIFINDGSRDRTLGGLRTLAAADPQRLRYLSLSRNFGHQIAVSAGLDVAYGSLIVIIDAVLQDPPELIPAMIQQLRTDGLDVVYAQRRQRAGESAGKRLTATVFYRLLGALTSVEIPADTGDFRVITQRVVAALRQMPERHKFLRGQIAWVGFRQAAFLYDRQSRVAGETGYTWRKMFRLATDALTAFSNLPLKLASLLGFLVSGVAGLLMVYTLYARFVRHDYQPGWASLMMTVLFLGGVQLIAVGIIGEYLARLGDNVRARPLYLIAEDSAAEKGQV